MVNYEKQSFKNDKIAKQAQPVYVGEKENWLPSYTAMP